MSPRASAIKILQKVIKEHQSLSDVSFDEPLTQEIVYGTLRWYWLLESILKKFLRQPLKPQDNDIHLLLLIGLYQLIYLDLPDYAVVNETVALTQKLRKAWAKKLVNAVLREFLRQKSQLSHDDGAQYSHPAWLAKKIKAAWPSHWQQILSANNQRPPFTLRINLQQAKRENYLPGELHPYNHCGITLPKAINIKDLPGFAEGKISVQDGAAQFAATLLDLKAGQTILDACAAPGGKTAHILEIEPQLKKLVALDIDEKRLLRIEENLQRLGFYTVIAKNPKGNVGISLTNDEIATATTSPRNDNILCLAGDAMHPATWWDQAQFDRILLDAPCSASGVIRRHPDIKFLRQEKDIKKLAHKQYELLETLWPLLKTKGVLVYSTCSIFPDENTLVIEKFLQTHTDAKEKIIEASWGITQPHGRQILPGMDNMDGFYYARLEKIA